MTLPGLLVSLAQAILVGATGPLLVGLIRLLKARLQGRRGASLVQPYRDLRKLLAKEVVLSVLACAEARMGVTSSNPEINSTLMIKLSSSFQLRIAVTRVDLTG